MDNKEVSQSFSKVDHVLASATRLVLLENVERLRQAAVSSVYDTWIPCRERRRHPAAAVTHTQPISAPRFQKHVALRMANGGLRISSLGEMLFRIRGLRLGELFELAIHPLQ